MKHLKTAVILMLLFILSVPTADAGQHELRIIYLNDFHGFAEPYRPFGSDEMLGGIAYLAGRVRQLRSEKASLLLAAGDMIQGNNWANLSQGQSVIELMNEMNFDAMVVGNHEFDFGQAVLKKRIEEARFPVLGANVSGLPVLRPYVIKEVGGINIAVLGIVTEDAPVSTHPKNVAGLTFSPAADTVQRYIGELRKRADIIIVLSHIGQAHDRALAERVRGIDIIVGGHSHTKVLTPVRVNETIIVQAWEHAKALGVLDITVEDGKIIKADGRLEEIRPVSGREDPAAAEIVEKYRKKVSAVLDERIGMAFHDLDGENVRTRETDLGNFIADIIRKASGADAAIINGGSIRTSVKKGDIKVKDIYSVLPFDNYIVAVKLSGRQIRETLEHGVSSFEPAEGRFPQVSGLAFTYNQSLPPGARVTEILVDGEKIDAAKEYTVATNDFLAAGGDGYKAFGDAVKSSGNFEIIGGLMKSEKLVYSDSGKWLRDVVVDYIRGEKNISPSVEGRIREVRDGP